MSSEKTQSVGGEGDRPGAGGSKDDRRRWAADQLARRIASSGVDSETAHRKAAEVARETDRKNKEK